MPNKGERFLAESDAFVIRGVGAISTTQAKRVGHETRRLEQQRDAAVRSGWLGGVIAEYSDNNRPLCRCRRNTREHRHCTSETNM